MKVIEINQDNFKDNINNGKVLVDCYATWCGPCRMLSPILDELAKEVDKCNYYKIDIDNAPDIAKKYGIMSIPTLLLFENGELKKQAVGFKNKEELHELIKD